MLQLNYKKRPLTQNKTENYANQGDSEFVGMFGEDGDDNSSDSEDEVISEPEVPLMMTDG